MLKNQKDILEINVEKASGFTNSVAFNIAAWCGVLYFVFFPLFFIYFSIALFLAIFCRMYLPFDGSIFEIIYYIVIGIYVLFLASFCIVEPIEKLKYNAFCKGVMIFFFIIFHIVSFCIFVWLPQYFGL